MIQEFDVVELVRDLPEYRLKKGDQGPVMNICEATNGTIFYIVEFSSLAKNSLPVEGVKVKDIKVVWKYEKPSDAS